MSAVVVDLSAARARRTGAPQSPVALPAHLKSRVLAICVGQRILRTEWHIVVDAAADAVARGSTDERVIEIARETALQLRDWPTPPGAA